MITLAHVGHWYVSLPIFMGPVLVLFALVYIGDRRDRRREKEGR